MVVNKYINVPAGSADVSKLKEPEIKKFLDDNKLTLDFLRSPASASLTNEDTSSVSNMLEKCYEDFREYFGKYVKGRIEMYCNICLPHVVESHRETERKISEKIKGNLLVIKLITLTLTVIEDSNDEEEFSEWVETALGSIDVPMSELRQGTYLYMIIETLLFNYAENFVEMKVNL